MFFGLELAGFRMRETSFLLPKVWGIIEPISVHVTRIEYWSEEFLGKPQIDIDYLTTCSYMLSRDRRTVSKIPRKLMALCD